MIYTFDTDIAEKYGLTGAVILQNLTFWMNKNKANNKNIHDGKVWTYNSISAFSKLFPWMSESQIKRALKKLEDEGAIETGNYNKQSYDRTKWYTVTCSLCIERYGLNHWTVSSNGLDGIVQPIPDNKPDSKPDSKPDNKPDNNKPVISPDTHKQEREEIISFLNNVLETRYRSSSKNTKKHINARLNEGFTIEDFKIVIEKKNQQWKDDPNMMQYLQPQTLFGEKFEKYLNQKTPSKKMLEEKDLSPRELKIKREEDAQQAEIHELAIRQQEEQRDNTSRA